MDGMTASARADLSGSSGEPPAGTLGERDAHLLDFEGAWWKFAGSKDEGIREQFGMSTTRYYQALNALLDDPAALAYDPLLVKRLRRERERRQRERSARRLRDN